MRKGSRRGNNGYLGADKSITPYSGVVTPNKIYNVDIRELPYYQFGNTANSFGVPAPVYERPKEWPDLPSVTAGSQQVVGLYAVFNNESNVCSIQISGNYTVDWGDGTVVSYPGSTIAIKRYDQASYAGLTSTVFRDYKTALIKITPQSGQTLTSINLATAATSGVTGITGYGNISSNNWLDIRMAGSAISGLNVSSWAGSGRSSKMLELFEFVGPASLTSYSFIDSYSLKRIVSFPSTINVTNWQSVFYGCIALQEIPRSALEGLANGKATGQSPYTFYRCFSLASLPIDVIDCRNITGTIDGMFNSCINLRRVPALINTANVTAMPSLFNDCRRLEEIPYLDTTRNTNFNFMFFNNISLKSIQSSFNGASGTNFTSTFQNCSNLTQLPYINTRNGQSFQDFARSALRLETVPSYDYTSATSFLRTFADCLNLKYVPTINNGSSVTTISNMFNNCQSLIDAPGMTTSNVTNISGLFGGCLNLRTIPQYNLSQVTTSTNPFPNGVATGTGSLMYVGLTGISFTVSFNHNVLGSTALDTIYNNLTTVGVSGAGVRTLTVSRNWGFTASNRSIAIGKGWAVT